MTQRAQRTFPDDRSFQSRLERGQQETLEDFGGGLDAHDHTSGFVKSSAMATRMRRAPENGSRP